MSRTLIAGIGNIFLGDDAFGVEVIAALAKHELPESVRAVDFGIRGLDLTFALLDGYETVILVDALPRGGSAGQIYVVEAELDDQAPPLDPTAPLIEMHRLDPAKVLSLVVALGGRLGRLLVVGCEPEPLDEATDIPPGMSDAVRAAIPVAVDVILELVGQREGGPLAANKEFARLTI
ncbi:MAG: hydrogenase maturation protease [Pirellulales bacterium]